MMVVAVAVMSLLLVGLPKAEAYWGLCCFLKCAAKPASVLSKRGPFNYPILAPAYGVVAIILSSQAWRNCKDQYPNAGPGRTNCQANMNTWVMPTFNNLSPVENPKTVSNTGNGGNFQGGMSS